MKDEKTGPAAAPPLESGLRAALESTTDSVFMLSADWRFTFLNRRADRQITGGRTLLGRTIWEAFPEAVGGKLWDACNRCMKDRVPAEAEEFYRPLGRHFAARAFPAEDGGLTVFFRDVTEERDVAVRLAEAEAMLRAVGEASPDLLYAKDRHGRMRYANPVTLAVVGRSAKQVMGKTDAEYMSDRGQGEAVMRNDERIMRSGRTGTVVEVVTDSRKGEARYWESIKTPLRDPATGATIGLVGIARDVTEARRAERELAASEARFREAFDQAVFGFAHVAPNGHWLRVNQRLCDMLGYSEEELLGRSYEDFTHPEDLEENRRRVRAVLTGETAVLRMDKRYIRKDGTPLRVNLTSSLTREENGNPRYFISVLQDTSRRSAVEAKLAASEARLQDLVKTLDLASIMVRDMDGTIRFWSAGCERLYGWTAQDALGQISHDLLHTVFPIPLPEIEGILLRDGEWSGDLHHRRRDGSELIAGARKVLRRDACGHPVAIMESVTDVTRLRQTQSELRRLNDELAERVRSEVAARERAQTDLAQAQRLEALGKLAGGIAHDFNNVLQAVSGAAGLIERRATDPERVRALARLVQEATERGSAITGRLLAFARRGDLRIATVEISELLNGLRDMLQQTLGAGIGIRVHVAEDTPSLLADPAQLETVLVNLAVNARDAMPHGGELVLSAAPDAIGDAHGDGPARGGYVRLDVTDTGSGMDELTRSRAAEPFFTTKPAGQGTGLGLAMARGFAVQSGGSLTIRSAPEEGTTVSLWLPQAPTESQQRALPAEAESTPGGAGRILLVDDDPLVRDVVSEQLRHAGYTVVAAPDGFGALGLIDAGETPDLLVTDFSMPGMNGTGLIREMRQRLPGLPAILITGYAEAMTRGDDGDLLNEITGILRKPVSAAELAERVADKMRAVPSVSG